MRSERESICKGGGGTTRNVQSGSPRAHEEGLIPGSDWGSDEAEWWPSPIPHLQGNAKPASGDRCRQQIKY